MWPFKKRCESRAKATLYRYDVYGGIAIVRCQRKGEHNTHYWEDYPYTGVWTDGEALEWD